MSFEAMAWAVKWKLPAQQKLVLIMLANRTNADTGRCDPSHKKLSRDCGMSADSVKRAIANLEVGGLLSIVRRTHEGVNLPNHYTLHLGVVGADSPDGWVLPAPRVGADSTTKQEIKQEEETDTSPGGDDTAGDVKSGQVDLLGGTTTSGCPHEGIIAAYHAELPNCPVVMVWSDKRREHLRARWKADPDRQAIDWWQGLFKWMRESDYLMGKVNSFQVSLPWLVKSEENLLKVIEGNYHHNRAGGQG
ncbi:helix-turn-helix domain-containing protein [Stenotrophomonas rhizophila]|uniref:helix-turn-helix domain-containing protein n=1 Tax=Stenotrophomonas rhizophila TaxID=216778 RepID=UPI0028A67F1B|nr:helix-turn-helix domain-containing protein [Stenotrophomonas rhizophila]